jgi:Glycosyltransferase family 9 (heptosyltransferase)
LLSLPGILGTSLATIPAGIPYLAADPARVEEWRKQLAGEKRLKVGIVWQGSTTFKNDRQRSIPVAKFAPLAGVDGAALFSLQAGPGTNRLAPANLPITDLGSRFDPNSLADLAAVLLNLDLLVSVDTAPAHLAGALGRPVWIALSFVPDWRWLMSRADSPWYPTARLFRQSQHGDWQSVIEAMAVELRKLVRD